MLRAVCCAGFAPFSYLGESLFLKGGEFIFVGLFAGGEHVH